MKIEDVKSANDLVCNIEQCRQWLDLAEKETEYRPWCFGALFRQASYRRPQYDARVIVEQEFLIEAVRKQLALLQNKLSQLGVN